MNVRRMALCVVLIALVSSLAFAQSPAGLGQAPFGSYSSANLDTVNLYSGNVLLDIPLFSLPGREGMGTQLRMTYNAQGWRDGSTEFETIGYYVGGWAIASPLGTG